MLGAGLLLTATVIGVVLVGALALAWLLVRRRGRVRLDDADADD